MNLETLEAATKDDQFTLPVRGALKALLFTTKFDGVVEKVCIYMRAYMHNHCRNHPSSALPLPHLTCRGMSLHSEKHGMHPGLVKICLSANPLNQAIELGLHFSE